MPERIVKVEWEDTRCAHGWQNLDEVPKVPAAVHSVGFVLEDEEIGITLVEAQASFPSGDGDGYSRFGCATFIPRSAISKVTELTRKR